MKTLINVCGPARSGTTMLDLMLGNGDRVFSCGEVYARYRPWRKHHFSIKCSCGEDPCPVWNELQHVPEQRFHSAALEKGDADFIIDSSKELCWVIDNQTWARESGIKVINILIWKNPLDLAYSHWKRGGGLTFWRDQFVDYYKSFFQTKISFAAVSFDELVESPSETLLDICKYTGMPYFPGKEEFWGKQHHHLFGSLGTRKQVERGSSGIKSTSFPPEFTEHISSLTRMIEQDKEVQNIISQLRERSLSAQPALSDSKQDAGHLRPWWYYYRRMKQMIYRIFPKPAPEES